MEEIFFNLICNYLNNCSSDDISKETLPSRRMFLSFVAPSVLLRFSGIRQEQFLFQYRPIYPVNLIKIILIRGNKLSWHLRYADFTTDIFQNRFGHIFGLTLSQLLIPQLFCNKSCDVCIFSFEVWNQTLSVIVLENFPIVSFQRWRFGLA